MQQGRASLPLRNCSVVADIACQFQAAYEERQTDEAATLAALAKLGYPNVKIADLPRLRSVDEYEEEMTFMADVRAYFCVSHKVGFVVYPASRLCHGLILCLNFPADHRCYPLGY